MPPLYNPMTGTRRDLEVDKEDGAAAAKTHARWVAKRIAYLGSLVLECHADARAVYEREIDTLKKGQ